MPYILTARRVIVYNIINYFSTTICRASVATSSILHFSYNNNNTLNDDIIRIIKSYYTESLFY